MTFSISNHRMSYWKMTVFTCLLFTMFLGLNVGAALHLHQASFWVLFVPLSFGAILSFAVMLGGLLCLYRDHRESTGQPELFFKLISRPVQIRRRFLGKLCNAFNPKSGGRLHVGDFVQVRSAAEILQTLDSGGALDGLPFMPEMLRFCGSRFRVNRRVDKINDMKTKTGLRRLCDTVTLEGLRCDGSGHDGCQAECKILWKDAWLQRVTVDMISNGAQADAMPRDVAVLNGSCVGLKTKSHYSEADGSVYFCQMTELLRASEPMSWWDARQDLRSLFSGNVGLIAFLVASLTRLFNTVQAFRGGCGYPYWPASDRSSTPRDDLGLKPGDRVRVKSKEAIAKTLDRNSRNRGLRFDREMIRFCGHRFAVRRCVSKIIGEDSGRMVTMKTLCITLEGVTATGEFLRFCQQSEFPFWREAWLQRDDSVSEMNGLNVMPCSIDCMKPPHLL